MSGAKIVEELLVGGRLFERIELLAVKILDERVSEHVSFGRVAHDGRNPIEARTLRRTPPALTHDEFVVARHHLADDDGLQEANFADGQREVRKRFLVEVLARLPRIGRDRADRHFVEVRTGHRAGGRFVVPLLCRAGRPGAR